MIVRVFLAITSLCTFIEMTNSRTSTMWKLNVATGKILTHETVVVGDEFNNYGSLDEDMLYNFNAMADVYSRDETFFTVVSSTRIDNGNGWLRQSAENSLETLLEARKLKIDNTARTKNKNSYSFTQSHSVNVENKIALRKHIQSVDTLDCGQPQNYTHYDYIINIGAQYKYKQTPLMPEPEVIYFFMHSPDKEDYRNFNVEALEKRLKRLKKQNPLSPEIYHHIGNYWRIIGDPIQAIKCFRRSLDIAPSESEVMYDLAKVLYNLQYLDDAIHMARRSIEFQTPPQTAWRQYVLLGDIMKTYGDSRGSIHYYRLALELNPTQELILKSLNEAEHMPTVTLHVYTIVIIIILVIMVLIVILTSMISEVRSNHMNGNCSGNLESLYDIKPQRHFNRAMAMRSLKGLSNTRSSRQRKY